MAEKSILTILVFAVSLTMLIFMSGCVQTNAPPEEGIPPMEVPTKEEITGSKINETCEFNETCMESVRPIPIEPAIEIQTEEPEETEEKEIEAQLVVEEAQPAVDLRFVRRIEVGKGGYPNIIFANNHFYVSYQMEEGRVIVKVYDKNFTATGEKYQLTDDEGWDHQMVFGNGYFYLVNPLYLRKFDSDWNEINSVPVTADVPPHLSIGDMLLHYADGSLYLGNAVGNAAKENGKKVDIPDDLYIRKYDENLNLENAIVLKDAGNTPGSSMMLQNETFTIVTSDRHWDDSSLMVVRYDANGNFIDNKTISAVSGANEEFPMGLFFENRTYFVSYQHITGYLAQPIVGEPVRRIDVALKVFDSKWNLLDQKMVTDDIPASALRGHMRAPHIGGAGNNIYVSYGIEDLDIFIKEYEIIYE